MCFGIAYIKLKAPVATPITKFKVGDQVKVISKAASHENGWPNVWVSDMTKAVGKIGKVVSVHSNEARLKINGTDDYFYPLFVLELVETPKFEVQAAVKSHNTAFVIAQKAAIELAKLQGHTNADQVQEVLVQRGYTSTDLGNAAGALFRGKNWKKIGTVKSARNHAREISTWKYIGT